MISRTLPIFCFSLFGFATLLLLLVHQAKAQESPAATDIRVLEERVKTLSDKVYIQQKGLDLAISQNAQAVTILHVLEERINALDDKLLNQKMDIDGRGSDARKATHTEFRLNFELVNEKINFYLKVLFGVITAFAAIAVFFGRQFIVDWVERKTVFFVKEEATTKVSKYVSEQLDYQSEIALKEYMNKFKVQAQTDLTTFLQTFDAELVKLTTIRIELEASIKKIPEFIKGYPLTKPPTPEESKKLSAMNKVLDESKFPEIFTEEKWAVKGLLAYQNTDYKGASDAWTNFIELNAGSANIYRGRGLSYVHQKRYDEAMNDYNKAIELNVDVAESYNSRGNLHIKLKRYDEALKDYNKAIDLNSNFAEAYNNRAIYYGERQNYDEALNDYNKAIELIPDYVDSSSNLAELHIVLNQPKQALASAEYTLSIPEIQDTYLTFNLYIKYLALLVLECDTDETERQLSAALVESSELRWNTRVIRTWLKAADLNPGVKQLIDAKTSLVEEHLHR